MVSNYSFSTPVRHAHVISTFGPGALQITQNGVCAITCGLPIWMNSLDKAEHLNSGDVLRQLTIRDSHMEQPLGVKRLIGPWPASDKPHPDSDWIIPAARFPLYEYCLNPSCHHLHQRDPTDYKPLNCNYSLCSDNNRHKWSTIQVPVVLACPIGHLSDIPWADWLHDSKGSDCPHPDNIRYQPGGTPKRPTVECRSCGRKRSLDPDEKFPCNGERPWLPGYPPDKCKAQMQVIERSSKTIYYACNVSSLAIPPNGVDNPELVKALHEVSELRTLRELFIEERSPTILKKIIDECKLQGIPLNPDDPDEVQRHIDALQESRDSAEDRPLELESLRKPHPRPLTGRGLPDLIVECPDMNDYDSQSSVKLFSEIALISRLRVVTVLTGFSRIKPCQELLSVNYEQLWGRPNNLSENDRENGLENWLPAHQVYGEGILFVFNKDVVDKWRRRIISGTLGTLQRPLCTDDDPAFVLAHTMAHLIMRAAAPYAGYPLPSIRERIYNNNKDDLAFLVYTAAGDIQGTLGGLVELGHPGQLEDLLDETIEHASWCTTDPVCIDDGIELGLYDTTHPGACHHCLLVPETSCERANSRLDRAAVVGTSSHDQLGILSCIR